MSFCLSLSLSRNDRSTFIFLYSRLMNRMPHTHIDGMQIKSRGSNERIYPSAIHSKINLNRKSPHPVTNLHHNVDMIHGRVLHFPRHKYFFFYSLCRLKSTYLHADGFFLLFTVSHFIEIYPNEWPCTHTPYTRIDATK